MRMTTRREDGGGTLVLYAALAANLGIAILIFATGAGLSIYEGARHLMEPGEIFDPIVNYIVLAVSILLEGGSWIVAIERLIADIEAELRARWLSIASIYIKSKAGPPAIVDSADRPVEGARTV
jgi:hypothetical protein